jgi:hypothetical protein
LVEVRQFYDEVKSQKEIVRELRKDAKEEAKYYKSMVECQINALNLPYAQWFERLRRKEEELVTRWEWILDLQTWCIEKLGEGVKMLEKSILERKAREGTNYSAGQDSEIDTKSQL